MPHEGETFASDVDHVAHSGVPVYHAAAASHASSIQVRVLIQAAASAAVASAPVALTDVSVLIDAIRGPSFFGTLVCACLPALAWPRSDDVSPRPASLPAFQAPISLLIGRLSY